MHPIKHAEILCLLATFSHPDGGAAGINLIANILPIADWQRPIRPEKDDRLPIHPQKGGVFRVGVNQRFERVDPVLIAAEKWAD